MTKDEMQTTIAQMIATDFDLSGEDIGDAMMLADRILALLPTKSYAEMKAGLADATPVDAALLAANDKFAQLIDTIERLKPLAEIGRLAVECERAYRTHGSGSKQWAERERSFDAALTDYVDAEQLANG
mgnify:CR=1 FL=1